MVLSSQKWKIKKYNFLPLSQYILSNVVTPKYDLQSTISVLFYLPIRQVKPFTKLQYLKRIIGFKINDFVFLPPHLAIFV